MTTTFDIDEIERLLAAATPGEWRTCALDQETQIWCGRNYIGVTRDYTGDDAALIVTLHNSAPAMLTEIRELRAENARLKGLLGEVLTHPGVAPCECQSSDCLTTRARAALGEPQ